MDTRHLRLNGFFLGSVSSNESISQTAHRVQLKRVESEIVEMKSKIEVTVLLHYPL